MRGAEVACAVALLVWWCPGSVRAQSEADDSLGWLVANERDMRAGVSHHTYYEGETGNFSCVRTRAARGYNVSVQFSYFSQETKAVSTTFKQQEAVQWYMKLRLAHNDTLLTCSLRDDNSDRTATVQLRLLLLPGPHHYAEGFEVNGLQVRPRGGAGVTVRGGTVRFEYRYLWDERMTVRLVRPPDYAVRCDPRGTQYPPAWLDQLKDASVASQELVLVNTSLLDVQSGASLSCSLRRRCLACDPFETDRVLELTFTYYDLVPFVGGLTMANVELMYIADNITTLYYDNDIPYTGNNTHYLTCKPDGVSWWVWTPGQVDVNPDKKADVGFPGAFRLLDGVTWSTVLCVRDATDTKPKRTVQLWLHRNAPRTTTTTSTTSTTSVTPAPALSTATPATNSDRSEAPAAPTTAAWWMAGAVGAAVTATTLLCVACIVCGVRRRWWRAPDRGGGGGGYGGGGRGVDLHSTRSSAFENIYEIIPELGLCGGSSVSAHAGESASAAARPPLPLPAEALEVSSENKRYRHYDTPYEWRIFRLGLGRRCRCGRCSAVGGG